MNEIDELITKYKNIEKTNGYDPMESEFECGESAGESRVAFEIGEDLKRLKSSLSNKQIDGIKELIDELENVSSKSINKDFEDGYNGGIRHALELAKEYKSSLPTQQDKVVVPELIHKWIKHVKGLKWGLADLLNPSVSNIYLARDAKEWLEKDKIHAEILARAWLEDDYTVEKEQLYYIELPLEGKTVRYCNQAYTEKQIKEIDKRYWAFAVPVEEEAE